MNYHLLSKNNAPLCPSKEMDNVFFTTDRTIGRDAEAIFSALGIDREKEGYRFARPHQTHTDKVLHIKEEFFSLPKEKQEEMMEGIDAVVSDVRNACLGISTADCIPVLVYDKEHHAAAAIHAGWRGTVKRIVEKTVGEMQKNFDTCPERCEAVIGPGISQESFEVGWEVHQQFVEAGFEMDDVTVVLPAKGGAKYGFTKYGSTKYGFAKYGSATDGRVNGDRAKDGSAESGPAELGMADDGSSKDGCGMKPHLDLKEINRRQLIAAGLKGENVMVSEIDTFTNEQYFSARREQKGKEKCGRILSGFVIGK